MNKYLFLVLVLLPLSVGAAANSILVPKANTVWKIGSEHNIIFKNNIKVNFPVDDAVIISLDNLNRKTVGIIDCIKKADKQKAFTWDTKTLMNSCGASEGKLKAVVPGKYRITLRRDGPGNTIIAQSRLFQIKGALQNEIISTTRTCSDFAALSDYVSNNIKKPDSQNKIEMNPNVISSFRWRRTTNEPYITYPIEIGYESNYLEIISDGKGGWKQTGTDVLGSTQANFNLLSKKLENKANDLGLSVDPINTQLETSYFHTKFDDYTQTFGFRKANDLYSVVIRYRGGQHQAPADGSVSVTCGRVLEKFDAVYNALKLKANPSAQNVYDDYVQIGNVSPDGNVYALVGSYSHKEVDLNYYELRGGRVELVSTGSYPAPCSVLESKKVGRGMKCATADFNTNGVVNY